MTMKLDAEHGAICSLENDFFGYFGWPTVARLDAGTLVAIASGLRNGHVCPFGRTTFFQSHDEGRTWTSPRVIHDSPLDDRDSGIVALGNSKLLVSWFTTDNRHYYTEEAMQDMDEARNARWRCGLANVTDANTQRFEGAWTCTSDDAGETWNPPVRTGLTTPHGPILLKNGELLYFAKEFGNRKVEFIDGHGRIVAARSADGGTTWQVLGEVPLIPGTAWPNYHEPHVVELPDGRLIGLIRVQSYKDDDVTKAGVVDFSIAQTESFDGGHSWTQARPLGFHGSPPHIFRHSSGTLVMSYGYRLQPYGERIAISHDDGASWQHDLVLRDDGPDGDLGYPASVELNDGSILTVYYQKPYRSEDMCAFLWSRWRLPV